MSYRDTIGRDTLVVHPGPRGERLVPREGDGVAFLTSRVVAGGGAEGGPQEK